MSRNLRPLPLALLGAALYLAGCPDFPESGKWACKADPDCQAGEVCGNDGACVARPNTGACSTDQDCGANDRCDNGSCVPTSICVGGADCPSGETCLGGYCLPIGQECRFNVQCLAEQVCVGGSCCTRECLPTATCIAASGGVSDKCGGFCQADCGIGQVCGPAGCCVVEGMTCEGGADCCSGNCQDLGGTSKLLCVR